MALANHLLYLERIKKVSINSVKSEENISHTKWKYYSITRVISSYNQSESIPSKAFPSTVLPHLKYPHQFLQSLFL